MKVKIGDKIYSSEKEPIMIILDDSDKENVSAMLPESSKYCSYPNEGFSVDEIETFMIVKEEQTISSSEVGRIEDIVGILKEGG